MLVAKTVCIDAGERGYVWTSEQEGTIAATFQKIGTLRAQRRFRAAPESHWGAELIPDNIEALARAVNAPDMVY